MYDNTEFLAKFHELTSDTDELLSLMSELTTIASTAGLEVIPVPTVMIEKISKLMAIQQVFSKGLLEENETILDKIDRLIQNHSV